MNRYSLINEKLPREFLLLQGTGCRWRKCTFCDYHNDVGDKPFEVNREVLSMVTGVYGVLDIINSGSCHELDGNTLDLISQTATEKKIHTVWFETHWMYKDKLSEFAARFPNINVKFRTGIETFDAAVRDGWNKGIPNDVGATDAARYFQGVCLLFGVEGQTIESVSRDIELASEYFEYFSVNAFVENSTALKRDNSLVERFVELWYDTLQSNPKAEVLINNTDLGVG